MLCSISLTPKHIFFSFLRVPECKFTICMVEDRSLIWAFAVFLIPPIFFGIANTFCNMPQCPLQLWANKILEQLHFSCLFIQNWISIHHLHCARSYGLWDFPRVLLLTFLFIFLTLVWEISLFVTPYLTFLFSIFVPWRLQHCWWH